MTESKNRLELNMDELHLASWALHQLIMERQKSEEDYQEVFDLMHTVDAVIKRAVAKGQR